MSDLVELAKELVKLDQRAEEIRGAMRKLLSTRTGDASLCPARPQGAPWGKGREAIQAHSKEEDAKVLDLLKHGPQRQVEIVKAIGSKPTTLQFRLKRLAEKGLVARNEGGLWSSPSTPS